MKSRALVAFCPECGDEIAFKAMPRLGQPVVCYGCRCALSVIGNNPVELEAALENSPHHRSHDRKRQDKAEKRERRRAEGA